jgi:hypothetical protein
MGESIHDDVEMSEPIQTTITSPTANMDSSIISQPPKSPSPTPQSNADLLVEAVKSISSSTPQATPPAVTSESNSISLNPEDPAQSVPMTATTSSSSHQDSKDDKATHYGTRSRNRPGISRPNYAEDVEMEFEQSTQSRVEAPPKALSPSAASRTSPPANTNAQKRASTNSTNPNGWNAVNNSSSIPGTSTFSANPNASVPKKRKQQAVATSSNGHTSAQTSSVSRRSHTANQAVGSKDNKGSDVYTFEKSNLRLKHGNLHADDGTVFKTNGK